MIISRLWRYYGQIGEQINQRISKVLVYGGVDVSTALDGQSGSIPAQWEPTDLKVVSFQPSAWPMPGMLKVNGG
jgi:hypothetical protein